MFGSNRLRQFWPWLAVLLITALAAQPLWGLPPQGDDLLLHYFRIPLVNAQWAVGAPLARWQPDLIYGYGSPLFNFYPPLSAWLLTGLYWLVGQQAGMAINLLFAACLLLGAVGMFGLGRALAGEIGGLLATAVFTLSPHIAAQIYSRGSTSNSLALAIVPLVAWMIWRVAAQPALSLSRGPSAGRVAVGAIAVALLMLSHTAVSLLLLGPLLLWGAVAVAVQSTHGRRRWLAVAGMFGLGLALSAFAWLPALTEIQYTRYAAEASKVFYGDHFTSLWDWPGTALSAGSGRAVAGLRGAYLPKTVGLVALILGAGGTAVSAWSLWRWRRKGGGFPARDALFFTAGFIGWAVLFLTLPASDLIWRLVDPLRGLQFPWRLLDVPAFFLPLAGLGLVNGIQYSVISKRNLVLLAGVILISYVNLVPYLYPPRWEGLPAQPTLADVTAVQQKYQIIGLTAWGEYSDARVTDWPSGPIVAEGSSLADKLLTAPSAGSTPLSSSGQAVSPTELIVQESDPWTAVWQTNFSQPHTLTFASHISPGWQASLDGDSLPIDADENGRLQLTVPAGRHTLTVQFSRTPVRWLADFLSVAGLLFSGFLLLKKPNHNFSTTENAEISHSLRPPRSPRFTFSRKPWSDFARPMVVGLLSLLLVAKVGWLDRFDSPLVVHPADGRIPGIPTPPAGNFNNEVRLVGVQTELPNKLTLYWQALQPPAASYRVALTLLDGQGVPRQTTLNPTPGYTVMANWPAGQLVRDDYTLTLPDDAPVGYTVQLSLLQPDSDAPLPLVDDRGNNTIAVARLKQPPPETASSTGSTPLSSSGPAVPAQAQSLGTTFGEGLVLSHVLVPETVSLREPLDVTLFWQVETAVSQDYTVFMHLLTPEGEFVAGQDGQPLDGLYPTSFWGGGEMVVDGRSWFADVSPGEYQLQMGLYLLETGQRLPVSGPHSELGDRVQLQTITIVP
ncbi:MAG: hypothetical protein CL608_01010 [Anaerolineaceae bacterium]|nr:hypothetical protein [Anaerolineaceae bacterium]